MRREEGEEEQAVVDDDDDDDILNFLVIEQMGRPAAPAPATTESSAAPPRPQLTRIRRGAPAPQTTSKAEEAREGSSEEEGDSGQAEQERSDEEASSSAVTRRRGRPQATSTSTSTTSSSLMRRLPSSRANVRSSATAASVASVVRRPAPTPAAAERVQIRFQDDDDFLGSDLTLSGDSGEDEQDEQASVPARRTAATAVSKPSAPAQTARQQQNGSSRGRPATAVTSSSSSSAGGRRRWEAETAGKRGGRDRDESEGEEEEEEEEEVERKAKRAKTAAPTTKTRKEEAKAPPPARRRRIPSDDEDEGEQEQEEEEDEEGEEKDIFEFYLPSHNGKGRPLSSLNSSSSSSSRTTSSSSSSITTSSLRSITRSPPASSSSSSSTASSLRPSASLRNSSSSSSSSHAPVPSSARSKAASTSSSSSASARATKPNPPTKPSSSSSSSTTAAAAAKPRATASTSSSRSSATSTSSRKSATTTTTKPAAAAAKKVEIEIDTDEDEEDDDDDFATPAAKTTTTTTTTKSLWLSPKRAAGKFTQYTRATTTSSAPHVPSSSASSSSSSSSSTKSASNKRPYAAMAKPSSASAPSTKRRAKTPALSPGAAIEGGRLWSDKYDPTSEGDLAVYPKRVAEVRDWLANALAGKSGRILCLTGPSGGGKTALLKVVARQLNVAITEWINPATCPWTDSDRKLALPYTAPIQEFRAFLQRTERYPSLITTTTTASASTDASSNADSGSGKRLILIEDLPFLGHLPSLRTFQELLLHHLRTPGARFPLVLIISDDSLGNSPLFRLLPQEIKSHRDFCQIKIAGVAPTRAAKVLAKIAGLEGWKGAGKATRGQATGVNALAKVCGGDLRSAINALQLLSGPGGTLTDQAVDSAQRDVPLSLFHALGKVLHNKRGDDGLPENEVEQVIEQAGIEPARFTEFVHENYPGFMADDIDAASTALEYLSDADTLQAVWEAREDTSPIAGALWARGFMYASRNALAPGDSHGYQPLFKPRLYAATAGQSSSARAVREVCGAGGVLTALAARPALLATEVFPYTHRIAFLRPTLRPLLTAPYPGGFAWLSEFCSYSRPSLAPPQSLREDEVADLPDVESDRDGAENDGAELEDKGGAEAEEDASEASEGDAATSKRPPQPTAGSSGRTTAPQPSSGRSAAAQRPPARWGHQHQQQQQHQQHQRQPPPALDPVLLEDDITDF